MPKTLAVIGGGPKAAAIVARAATLRELLGAAKVPDVLVFEKRAIGPAWSGDGGYSSGHLPLCSPAEQHFGFPYSEVRRRHTQGPLAPPPHRSDEDTSELHLPMRLLDTFYCLKKKTKPR